MITISLCMIVKNEEYVLERCLNCVKDIVDEIIIIDTGSTDKTKEIAKKWTPYVYDFEWIDDFSAARNTSFSYATKEYIFWLDADDILTLKDQEKMKQLKKTLSSEIDAVHMKYEVAFNKDNQCIASTYRMRLIKRDKFFKWIGFIHENLVLLEELKESNNMLSNIIITHKKEYIKNSNRNIKIYENALKKGYSFNIFDIFNYARECQVHKKYKTAIKYYEKCKDNFELSLHNRLFVYHQLATCYYMIEDLDKEHEITLKSFDLDIPYPPFCCRMGEYFIKNNNLNAAIYWYKIAHQPDVLHSNLLSIDQPIYRTILPCEQLIWCYKQLKNDKEAQKYISYLQNYKKE